jgi:ankyrin repeat protein
MRLLKREPSGEIVLTQHNDKNIPLYAILSHTWGEEEVIFQDVEVGTGKSKAGWEKIEFCAAQAAADGLQYSWVDTCCIDKKNAVELAEAINSMFRWYQRAEKCYVFLSDVSATERKRPDESAQDVWEQAFRRSRWFARGWTLQELLAPRSVEFFSKERKRLGDKHSLEHQIQQITDIAAKALQGSPLKEFSVDERMRWAERRDTTKEEDQAYCLLGIFGIHLPLIYGEGKDNALSRLREQIQKREEAPKYAHPKAYECLQTLRTSDYEQFKDRNPNRLEGTCRWFLRHDHFLTWQQASSALLWVSADPGCGKSVLAKSLVDQYLRPTEDRVCCFFFFKDDNDKQTNINYALSALLHQLFSQKRSLLNHALREYEVEGPQLVQSFHKLWSILLKATSDPDAGEIVCILDALDECEELGRYQIIEALNTLYKQTTVSGQSASGPSASQLKFIVTSRPYYDIERRFKALTHQFPTIRLQGEQESEAISREISVVIKWRVSELGNELGLETSEQSTLEEELSRVEHRTYLWLRLIVEVIRDEIVLTKRRLKQIVDTIPTTVEHAYEAILSRVREKDHQRAQKLLRIIVAAIRPLTLKEMSIALALSIDESSRSYENLDLEEEGRFKTTIRNICGLFVNVVDQKVYLIHQTAKEFLIRRAEDSAGGWKNSINILESELLMAKICIAFLKFTAFRSELLFVKSGTHYDDIDPATVKLPGFLSYAACFWASHYRQAQRSATMELLRSVLDICETETPRYKNWFWLYCNMVGRFTVSPDSFSNSLFVGSFFGHESVVQLLLNERDDIDVKAKDDNGRTALMLAAKGGYEAVVKQLLVERDDVDINAKDKSWHGRKTALMLAADGGHEAVVKLLLKERDEVNVNAADRYGRTALMLAAKGGYEAVVKQLLVERDDVDINAKDESRYGRTALMLAAEYGHEAVIKQMLAERDKIDINAKDESWEGLTALMLAAKGGHEAVVKQMLVERDDVEVNSGDRYGRTALMLAAELGHEAVVKQLLIERNDMDIHAKEKFTGRTALMLAAECQHWTVVQQLKNASLDSRSTDCIIRSKA